MREIYTVRMMGIIVNAMWTINKSLGRPKNLFSLEVK
jgi:hypothetical protein